MLSCKEASRLLSESLDHKLPFGKRLSLRFHLMMCSACRAYRRQVKAVQDLSALFFRSRDSGQSPTASLSPDARMRLQNLINEHSD